MKVSPVQTFLVMGLALLLAACNSPVAKPVRKSPKVTVAPVEKKPVKITEQYPCQIRAHHHVEIRAAESGYLESIKVKDRQTVQKGDVLFLINYKKLFDDKSSAPPSDVEKARVNIEAANLAKGAAPILAPFDGVVDRISLHEGTVVQKGEVLTTLSDNSVVWAYFHVAEARYLDFREANVDHHKEDLTIELMTTSGKKFDHPGKFGAIGADFNSSTGTIPFRADFPNPEHVLRHGQTGMLLISRIESDAIVVPLKATLEVNHKRYVFIVDKENVARQREIIVQNEVEEGLVIKSGVTEGDTIVIEGIRMIRDGEKVDVENAAAPQKLASSHQAP